MKKMIAMLLLIGMSMGILAGCGDKENSDADSETDSAVNSGERVTSYEDYEIGDMLYNDDSVSFAITALTQNSGGSYTMTISATDYNDTYDFVFSLLPYDTEEFEQYDSGEISTISKASDGVTFYIDSNEGDPEISSEFDWDAQYIYYGVTGVKTSEKVTESNIQEVLESNETETVLDTIIKIDISGVTT